MYGKFVTHNELLNCKKFYVKIASNVLTFKTAQFCMVILTEISKISNSSKCIGC